MKPRPAAARTASANFVLQGTTPLRLYALLDAAGALRGVLQARDKAEALAAVCQDRPTRALRRDWTLVQCTVTWSIPQAEALTRALTTATPGLSGMAVPDPKGAQ